MTEPAERDPYAVLGVPRGATDRQIVAAHRALARRFHPDIAGDAATASCCLREVAGARVSASGVPLVEGAFGIRTTACAGTISDFAVFDL